MNNVQRSIYIYIIACFIILFNPLMLGGPPFNTDDPVPVDFRHWEFYIASSFQLEHYDDNATLPHIEINYGVIPDVQIHLLTGMDYAKEDAHHQYGFMATELGFKYRFINDVGNNFQVGIFPLIELPTSSGESPAANNHLQTFLPVWIQKSWGKFTTYGGAGYWINPGENNKNSVFAGWQAQYDFTETLSVGGELYYESPDIKDGTNDISFKVGGLINLNEQNHLLLSIGHSLKNTDVVSGYLGYQLTI